MINIRRGSERGQVDFGWLRSNHTFSFGEYHDPRHMGFGVLRVINEDRVAPGQGFGTHPHNNMEIISYVVSGQLAHRDSMGNVRTIRPGEFQVMSAGTGVTHSEYNPSQSDEAHFLQIWIIPAIKNVTPSYAELLPANSDQALTLICSGNASTNAMRLHQDAEIWLVRLPKGANQTVTIPPQRRAWLQIVSGTIITNGVTASAGDGLAVSDETALNLSAEDSAVALYFQLPVSP